MLSSCHHSVCSPIVLFAFCVDFSRIGLFLSPANWDLVRGVALNGAPLQQWPTVEALALAASGWTQVSQSEAWAKGPVADVAAARTFVFDKNM